MSFLYDMLTKEEMEEIREHDGYVRGLKDSHASGVQEGHASGIKEGLARGAAERDRDIAANMLAKGMDTALISELTGLSEQDIAQLRQTDTTK